MSPIGYIIPAPTDQTAAHILQKAHVEVLQSSLGDNEDEDEKGFEEEVDLKTLQGGDVEMVTRPRAVC